MAGGAAAGAAAAGAAAGAAIGAAVGATVGAAVGAAAVGAAAEAAALPATVSLAARATAAAAAHAAAATSNPLHLEAVADAVAHNVLLHKLGAPPSRQHARAAALAVQLLREVEEQLVQLQVVVPDEARQHACLDESPHGPSPVEGVGRRLD